MSTTTDTNSVRGQWQYAMYMDVSDEESVEAYNIMMEKGEDKNEQNNDSKRVENKDIEMMTFAILMDDVDRL